MAEKIPQLLIFWSKWFKMTSFWKVFTVSSSVKESKYVLENDDDKASRNDFWGNKCLERKSWLKQPTWKIWILQCFSQKCESSSNSVMQIQVQTRYQKYRASMLIVLIVLIDITLGTCIVKLRIHETCY